MSSTASSEPNCAARGADGGELRLIDLRQNAADPFAIPAGQKLLRLDQLEMRIEHMAVQRPALDVERRREARHSRIEQTRELAKCQKPKRPLAGAMSICAMSKPNPVPVRDKRVITTRRASFIVALLQKTRAAARNYMKLRPLVRSLPRARFLPSLLFGRKRHAPAIAAATIRCASSETGGMSRSAAITPRISASV